MKATSLTLTPTFAGALAGAACLCATLTTAACAIEVQDEPVAPAVTQETQNDTYLDAPQTPGTWEYENEPGEKLALFGETPRQPVFLVRCGDGAIALGRVTATSQTETRVMNVVTETVSSQLELSPVPGRDTILAARLDPQDPLLDAMAITKGRFMIDVEGEEALYLPAWVEVSRVIEDCR